jgi:glycerophosphoryl diester phosphodiesterase
MNDPERKENNAMKEFRIYAHRGYSEKYPENTLLAFSKAFECGADGVECDLQKTKDGKYVVIHDCFVDRVSSNIKGYVREMTLSEIKTCDLGSGQTVPEFGEFLEKIPEGKFLDLELKNETITEEDCPEIYDILVRHISREFVLISSFESSLLPYFRKKGVKTGLLVGKVGLLKLISTIIKTNPYYLNLPVQMFQIIGKFGSMLFIRFMMFFGKKIIFYTVDNGSDLANSMKYSQMFITDRVEFIPALISHSD